MRICIKARRAGLSPEIGSDNLGAEALDRTTATRRSRSGFTQMTPRGCALVSAVLSSLLGLSLIGPAVAQGQTTTNAEAETVVSETTTNVEAKATVIIVVGAAGEADFGAKFEESASLWRRASELGGIKAKVIGLGDTNGPSDLEQLNQALAQEPKSAAAELWLVLFGHGTYDSQEAKFNLRGPDLTATNLAAWLQPFQRPLAVINCASASAPFLNKLSAQGRVIVTATRSGYEQNYARFGLFLAKAINDPEADLDKDGQVSLLEAFLTASHQVAEFYQMEGRLATEHALLDDNGDGLGTPADWFRGIRATKRPKDDAGLDGRRAHQFHLVRSDAELKLSPEKRQRRDELELTIANLRDQKSQLKEDDYYQQLEVIMVELARIYE